MSNEMVFIGGSENLPEHLQQYQDKAKEAAQMVTSFNSLPRLSIRGKQFRFDRDGKEVVYPAGQALDVVILAIDPPKGCAKSFYAGAYVSGTDEMPDCFSSDGVSPDSFVDNPKARSCAECPLNAFGSGTDAAGSPSKGKACSDHKNLFVVEAGDLKGEVYVLRVPATSLKPLSQYGRMLSKHSVAPQVIVTQMTFTDAEHPQLEFKGVRYLNAEEAPVSVGRSESDEITMALPSQNKIDVADGQPALPPGKPVDVKELAKPDEPPAPPPKEPEYVMTAKADGLTLDDFKAKNWTIELLIKHKYMEQK